MIIIDFIIVSSYSFILSWIGYVVGRNNICNTEDSPDTSYDNSYVSLSSKSSSIRDGVLWWDKKIN